VICARFDREALAVLEYRQVPSPGRSGPRRATSARHSSPPRPFGHRAASASPHGGSAAYHSGPRRHHVRSSPLTTAFPAWSSPAPGSVSAAMREEDHSAEDAGRCRVCLEALAPPSCPVSCLTSLAASALATLWQRRVVHGRRLAGRVHASEFALAKREPSRKGCCATCDLEQMRCSLG
jgi:hypothetical protein